MPPPPPPMICRLGSLAERSAVNDEEFFLFIHFFIEIFKKQFFVLKIYKSNRMPLSRRARAAGT